MTTDTTSKPSENPKMKKLIRHADEGKQSKKERSEDTVWISGKSGPAITIYCHKVSPKEPNLPREPEKLPLLPLKAKRYVVKTILTLQVS